MIAMNLTDVTMIEYFNQLKKDNEKISKIMLDDNHPEIYACLRAINANLSFFQRNYQGRAGFEIWYGKLVKDAQGHVKKVMEKYEIPLRQKVMWVEI